MDPRIMTKQEFPIALLLLLVVYRIDMIFGYKQQDFGWSQKKGNSIV